MLGRILNSPWLYFALAGLLAVVAVASQFDLHLPTRPEGTVQEDLAALKERDDLNVVFILIDTLRADRMSSYGYERETSPLMDRLARYGVRFEHVQSQSSWTKTSMASLWMAEYPARTGVLRFPHVVPEEVRMPAEIFKEAGYTTGGIFRNGWVEANFGFAQGFDLYLKPGLRGGRNDDEASVDPSPSPHDLPGTDEHATTAALQFLQSHARDPNPFLLYVHYMDVHQYVYDGISAKFGSSYSDAYDNAIHWTDRNVALLMDELDRLGLFDETIVVIASDHGEAFREHGFEGHAKNLYREVTEVPLILSLPFRLDPGVVVPEVASNVDVWPTVLELAGLPPMEGADGRSLVPAIEAAARSPASRAEENGGPDRPVYAERPVFAQLDRNWARTSEPPNPVFSLVSGPYRFIYWKEHPDRLELYDRSVDPLEQRNIAEEATEVTERLRGEVETHIAAVSQEDREVPEVEITGMRRAQLRALGYAVGGGRQEGVPEEGGEESEEEEEREEATQGPE